MATDWKTATHDVWGVGWTDGARWRFALASADAAGALVRALDGTSWTVDGAGDAADVVLDLSGLDALKGIDPESGVAHVESGHTWDALERRLGRRGFTLGPIPDWLRGVSIAAFIADSALSRPSPRYGCLRDALLGLRAALPQGVTRSAVAPRRATGPDLGRLPSGAHHRAGLVTDVHLRLWPLSDEMAHRTVLFRGWNEAREAAVAALRAGVRPAWWCVRRIKRKVALYAELHGPDVAAAVARFDAAMVTGQAGDAEAARALGEARMALPDGPMPPGPYSRVADVRGADLGEGVRGVTKAEVWDLRPEGATVSVARDADAPAVDPEWAALSAVVFGALADGGDR